MTLSHIVPKNALAAFMCFLLAMVSGLGGAIPTAAQDNVRAEKPLPKYYVYIDANNAFWSLRINGATVFRDFEGGVTGMGLPISHYLRQGKNVAEITFVSLMGDPFEYNASNPEFYIHTSLMRSNWRRGPDDKVTLLNIALDPATNTPIIKNKTPWGSDVLQRPVPPMVLSAPSFNQATLATGWGGPQESWIGRTATVTFEIDDPFPAPGWADAPVMEDTPETRAKLLGAYRELHAALESNDRARIRAFYEPAWKVIRLAMNYESVDEFIEKSRVFEHLARESVDGEILQPLDLVRGDKDFEIEFMDNGRLARIIPSPIIWTGGASSFAKDPAEFTTSTDVAFFQDSDGTMKIGVVVF